MALLSLALPPARAEERVLTTIREIQALSTAEAQREPVVRLQSVLTMRYAYRHATYVHDGTGGIYLRLRRQDVPVGLTTGKLLEIEGVAWTGLFATEITGPKSTSTVPMVRSVGSCSCSKARQLSSRRR